MKSKLSFAAILVVAMIYAGCKKSNNATPAGTVSDEQVSLQVAQNLVKMLNGGFGYDPTSSGLSGNSITKRRVNSKGSGCNVSEDTTLNFTAKLDTVSEAVNGKVSISANTCSSPVVLGIIENYTLIYNAPSLSGNYKLTANLSFSFADDPNNIVLTYSGTMGVNAGLKFLTGSKGSSNQTFNYNFNAITADESGIKSGSASFTTTGAGSTGNWNYTGTITFLGGNKADITLGKKTYHVNLTTGAVTAA